MQNSKNITTVQLATGNKFNPTVQLAIGDNREVDILLKETSELQSTEFKSWYAKCYRQLGKDRVFELASQAKADGQNPKKLFSYLLKKATA